MISCKAFVWEYSGILQNMQTYAEFLVETEILSVSSTILNKKVVSFEVFPVVESELVIISSSFPCKFSRSSDTDK